PRSDQLRFARCDPSRGPEHLRFGWLELRGHEPLGAGERLTPFVVGRHAILVRVRDLDVVAEDLVEPDLEGRDRGALPLARLERGDVLLPAVARVFELVQLAIVARADGVAVRR